MSREIFLYSKNKKYKCAVELADSCDHFGCPENSVMILFEKRKDGTYIIAQARDKRLETEKDRIVADLETKLAEKDQELNDICQNYDFQINDFSREVYRLQKREKILEQQLAEKDGQIEQLKKFDNLNRNFYDILRTAFRLPNKVDDLFNSLKTMQEKQDQDKISFAVEKLEQIKKFLYSGYAVDNEEIEKEIDNQIKQLKEGK